jgi:hypothetical protein
MTVDQVLVGYEIGSGLPVYMSLHHLAIFGMSALSGKTTGIEGFISRSKLRAIAFITKRGEGGFTKFNFLMPYYKPRSDWQYVESLVNVALGEKVKYEPGMRSAIMKVCRGRKDLKEIQLVSRELAKTEKSGFMRAVYERLDEYLDIVIPELAKWTFTVNLDLKDGVNVMDLKDMRLETQQLVIASTIEHVFAKLDHVIIIIPEAWEMIPQGRMTPVKWVAQQFIRKGAALGNYLWLDSQDIGGIDKTPLRQVDNWLMGRMKEAHEIERILKQLLGVKVPAEEIQTLPLGHFYAAIGNMVKKVYVLPTGVPENVGEAVARGIMTPLQVKEAYLKPNMEVNDEMYKEMYEEEKRKREECEKEFARQLEHLSNRMVEEKLRKVLQDYVSKDELQKAVVEADLNGYSRGRADAETEERPLPKEVVRKVAAFDALNKALIEFAPTPVPTSVDTPVHTTLGLQPIVTVVELEEIKRELPKVPSDTVKGKVLRLVKEEFFKTWKALNEVQSRLDELALGPNTSQTVTGALAELVEADVLGMKHTDRNRWKLAPNVIIS